MNDGKPLFPALALAALLVMTGCGINGKWSLSTVSPTAARRDFEFQSLTLQRDGTFYAEALEPGGEIGTRSGTYTYKDGTLQLVAHDGESYTYDAKLRGANDLELKRGWDGRTLEAELVRRKQ
jgi:hypothetical protein